MKPALTREEWHEGYASPGLSVTVRPSMSTPGMRVHVTVRDEPLGGALGEPRDIHALAALCLHGQPFGFTREDVRHLREMAASRVCHGHGDYGPPDSYDPWITNLADRIEALLPPED